MAQRRPGTRERIQQVALELFAERGYDDASMREIAERVGLTKAALYYHFRTKEDILASAIEDVASSMDELSDWLRAQPASAQTRVAALERLVALVSGRLGPLARFAQENRAVLRRLPTGERMRERGRELLSLFDSTADDVADRLRGRLAVTAVLMGSLEDPAELGGTEASVRAAVRRVAGELLRRRAGDESKRAASRTEARD